MDYIIKYYTLSIAQMIDVKLSALDYPCFFPFERKWVCAFDQLRYLLSIRQVNTAYKLRCDIIVQSVNDTRQRYMCSSWIKAY